jgi:hypothetical protein
MNTADQQAWEAEYCKQHRSLITEVEKMIQGWYLSDNENYTYVAERIVLHIAALQSRSVPETWPYTCPNCNERISEYEVKHGHTCTPQTSVPSQTEGEKKMRNVLEGLQQRLNENRYGVAIGETDWYKINDALSTPSTGQPTEDYRG